MIYGIIAVIKKINCNSCKNHKCRIVYYAIAFKQFGISLSSFEYSSHIFLIYFVTLHESSVSFFFVNVPNALRANFVSSFATSSRIL